MSRQLRETAKHHAVFEEWYVQNRNFRNVADKTGQKRSTLYEWADRFDWHERADARDQAAQKIADEEAVKKKAERAKKRLQAAELMTVRGIEFFGTNKIQDERAAIQAIKHGNELQRKEEGIPDWVAFILNADENTLQAMAPALGLALPDGESSGEGDGFGSSESDADEDEDEE